MFFAFCIVKQVGAWPRMMPTPIGPQHSHVGVVKADWQQAVWTAYDITSVSDCISPHQAITYENLWDLRWTLMVWPQTSIHCWLRDQPFQTCLTVGIGGLWYLILYYLAQPIRYASWSASSICHPEDMRNVIVSQCRSLQAWLVGLVWGSVAAWHCSTCTKKLGEILQ